MDSYKVNTSYEVSTPYEVNTSSKVLTSYKVNTSYKVVGRHKPTEQQQSWCRGKEGTQAKKRVYVCEEDYLKYAPKLMERWNKLYDVELYKMVDGRWVLIAKY